MSTEAAAPAQELERQESAGISAEQHPAEVDAFIKEVAAEEHSPTTIPVPVEPAPEPPAEPREDLRDETPAFERQVEQREPQRRERRIEGYADSTTRPAARVPTHPAEASAVKRAIEDVNQIIETLKSTLDDMEELLETLELAERQKDADEQEIEALRRSLRHMQRPREGGSRR